MPASCVVDPSGRRLVDDIHRTYDGGNNGTSLEESYRRGRIPGGRARRTGDSVVAGVDRATRGESIPRSRHARSNLPQADREDVPGRRCVRGRRGPVGDARYPRRPGRLENRVARGSGRHATRRRLHAQGRHDRSSGLALQLRRQEGDRARLPRHRLSRRQSLRPPADRAQSRLPQEGGHLPGDQFQRARDPGAGRPVRPRDRHRLPRPEGPPEQGQRHGPGGADLRDARARRFRPHPLPRRDRRPVRTGQEQGQSRP